MLLYELRSTILPCRRVSDSFSPAPSCLPSFGTSLNLAPVEFATVTGVYIATLFVVFQITNFVFFHVLPTPSVYVGGAYHRYWRVDCFPWAMSSH